MHASYPNTALVTVAWHVSHFATAGWCWCWCVGTGAVVVGPLNDFSAGMPSMVGIALW